MASGLSAASAGNAVYAMDTARGDTVSVWQAYSWPDVDIHAAIEIGTWSSTTVLSSPMVCINCRDPKVAINSEGQAIALWTGTDPLTYTDRLFASVYDGASWSMPEAISDSDEYIADSDYKVLLSSTGDANIMWRSLLPLTGTMAVRVRPSDVVFGTWRTIITISP